MAHTAADVVSNLPAQILEVLRDQRMSLTQVSTYFSVKYRSSLNERLKGAKVANLKEYLEGLSNIFEVQGEFVKARPKSTTQTQNSGEPAITSIRYAHVSKGIQNILNENSSKSMAMTDLENTFKAKHGVTLGSVIGMPTVEYLQRKANVFEIEGEVVRLQIAFHKETTTKTDPEKSKDLTPSSPDEKGKGGLSPIAEENDSERTTPKARQAWADMPLLPETSGAEQELNTEQKINLPKQKASPAQKEPLQALDGLLSSLRSAAPAGQAKKDTVPTNAVEVQSKPDSDVKAKEALDKKDKKNENLPLFAVDELVRIFEENSEGPIMHSSVLCSLFMQQLGASVTEISGKKPMELFRQHPQAFIWLSSGNVALTKYRDDKAVQHELKLLDDQPKCVRVKAAAAEASLPVPDKVTEEDVVNYMIGLLKENEDRDSIYISALCGRFMQRFRKPVTEIVGCKPTDFLKKYKDVFYLEKGGHVKLVKNDDDCSSQPGDSEALASKAAAQNQEKAATTPATQTCPVTVAPPVRPWRRAPEADKETSATSQHSEGQQQIQSAQVSTHESVDPDVQQKVDEFCTRLRKQLFFRVTEVITGSASKATSATQGCLAEIPVTVKVTNLPKEIEAQWLPQLLCGLEQVLNIKFSSEVDGVTLEGDIVRCRFQHSTSSIGLCMRLVVV
eukprot:gnl/MRDRNA2_/MRDRNA2_54142_c0_seq1.p1 gnl/MRDRNA2_/MRDRNA2_54142_c0~~gnl/MRDRNA2_/MRDRNA2_54142_c0_seq1.p1  ORF type:complete len:675 (-),score=167.78 gnl/MRDRNA2_/MRDRNA2_54142_c0_seq1:71-2095(-)